MRRALPHDPDQVTEIDPRSHYSFVLTAHAAGGTSEPSVAAALPPDPNPSCNPNPNPNPNQVRALRQQHERVVAAHEARAA